jgi:hypothetical protein
MDLLIIRCLEDINEFRYPIRNISKGSPFSRQGLLHDLIIQVPNLIGTLESAECSLKRFRTIADARTTWFTQWCASQTPQNFWMSWVWVIGAGLRVDAKPT